MNSARRTLTIFALLVSAAAAASAKQPGDFGGSYSGEVIVRSLSGTRIVVGIDEHGLGQADRLFFVDTARAVGPFSYRSAVAKVEQSSGQLTVVVPREQKVLVFQAPAANPTDAGRRQAEHLQTDDGGTPNEIDGDLLQKLGYAVVRVDAVLQLAGYAGMRQRVTLDEVESGSLEGLGPRVLRAAGQSPQNQVPPGPDDGSGCRTACSTTCGGGSSCNATCTNGHCASCDCSAGHGASCSCN